MLSRILRCVRIKRSWCCYKVYKNTMMNFAFKGTPCEELCQHLEGTNALAVCADDATAPARILAKYAKDSSYSGISCRCRRRYITTIRQEWKHCPRSLQEKNFLENFLEAFSLLSQTSLVCLIRSLNSRHKEQQFYKRESL